MIRQIAAIPRVLNPLRLTGPILDKELRVSSRRKRNYVLRSVYLAILLLAVVMIWVEVVDTRYSSAAYVTSRLADAGLLITVIVIACQFYIAQLLSAIMLSNSISDEIYHKTLGSLMSTPINSFQIVVGKLLGKLLQLILLMCLTLPILAIVRVFGGVPWDFLIRSLCLTMTAILFAGLLSLNISIHNKHAYAVIISSIVLLFALYILLPLVAGWAAHEYFHIHENTVLKWVSVTNPPMMMMLLIEEMSSPHGMPFSSSIWRFNCLFMLGCSAVLLVRAVVVVRKKALRQACGQLDSGPKKPSARKAARQAKIRCVKGNPLIRKELRRPSFNIGRVRKAIALFLLIGGLLTSYSICAVENELEGGDIQMLYCMIFMILGIFCTTVLAATAISSEKNSRTWPALLSTLITSKQIVFGKMLGVFRRGLPVWTLLPAHVVAFVFVRKYIHPAAILQILIVVIPAIILVTSSGLFFSNKLKHTTSAVIANLAFCGFLWAGIPLIAAFLSILAHDDALIKLAASVNPFYHMGMILDKTAGKAHAAAHLSNLMYEWPDKEMAFAPTTIILIMIAAGSLVASAFFLTITSNSLRRKIF